jgi:hypothetical protein
MKPSRLLGERWGLNCLLVVSLLACEGDDESFVRHEPPPDEGVYGHAHGCYAVEGFDGENAPRHLAANGSDAFTFSAATAEGASHFRLQPSDLGTFLLYDTEGRYLTAEDADGSSWRLSRKEELESSITLLDDDFRSPAEWELMPSERDPERYQLKHYRTGHLLTLTGLTSDPQRAAIITLYPQEGCADFPELTIDATGEVEPRRWDDGDLFGIAEIHSHMFTNFGFGGGNTFHGAPFHRLGVERALPDCEPWHGPEGRRDVMGFFYDQEVALDTDALLPIVTTGEVPEHNHETAGYPKFTEWPSSWNRATHQTMYYRWLERAWLAGLRLLVQHATGNSVLCELVTGIGSQTGRYSCNDMVSVDRSIEEARNLERYIDAQSGGPGQGWFRIVESPAEARDIIDQGKLAVVLGIEISNLFNCFLTPREGFPRCTGDSVRAELDRYHALGVRVIFPVHKFDNAFSAGDGQGGIIELGNFINTGQYSSLVTDCPGLSTAFDKGDVTFGGLNQPRPDYDGPAPADTSGFGEDPIATLAPYLSQIQEGGISGEYCQKFGMTPLGVTLMHELMRRGMLIDVAHLPQRSLARAYEILEDNDYPATKTHGSTNGGRIYGIGGLAGTRLGRCSDPDQPGAMGDRLRTDVQEAIDHGAYPAEGLSFDLNGFAGGPRPRFGEHSGCEEPQENPITYPFASFDGTVTFEQPRLGEREVDFNNEGMIHIGLLPELIEDVRNDGVTDDELEPLFRSAEAYVRMWEKAEARGAALR